MSPSSPPNQLSSSKADDPDTAKQDEAQFRLIHQYSFSSAEEAENCRSFANFSKKYSMGVNGCHPATQTIPASSVVSSPQTQRCCCGLLGLQTAAIFIALLEMLFFLYQIFTTSMAYEKTGDEYALAFSLTIFSFVLCIVAVVLLLVGLKKKSPYFLVPHLLMQFAILSSTFMLVIYFTLLLVGGTSVKVDAIFYEDSPRGELGLAQATRLAPVKAEVVARGLNSLLLTLLVLTVLFFIFQMWLFLTVRRCYQGLRHLAIEKPSLNGNSTSTMLKNTTECNNGAGLRV